MIGKQKEEWMELCELAANEQDPAKLMKLVAEINRLLEAKEQRLKSVTREPAEADSEGQRQDGGS
jgi:hypothetical protein